MDIVVLCGGCSSEREISLRSSLKIASALRSRGHRVILTDVYFGSAQIPSFEEEQDFEQITGQLRELSSQIPSTGLAGAPLMGQNVLAVCKMADIVFIGLHGENGEDGKIQALLDAEKIPYTGSGSAASAIAMSKEQTKHLVAPYIRMPKGIVHRKGSHITEKIPAPCVLKPSNGGSSVGVFRITQDDQYEKALEACFQYDDTVIAEEMIIGRELTQGVLNGVALPPVEICAEQGEWYDYVNKYSGETKEICPAQIPAEILQEMSESSLRFGELLGLSVYYRIDYLLDADNRLYALEANSLPGMTDTSLVPQEAAAVGISFPELCDKIVELSLKKQEPEGNA